MSILSDDPPEGLLVGPFLTQEEQDDLLGHARCDNLSWEHIEFRGRIARRRMICWGYRYQTTTRRLGPAGPIPAWLAPFQQRAQHLVHAALGQAVEFHQAILTWYPDGAGIGFHRDSDVFGDVVVGVGMSRSCRMVFRRAAARWPVDLAAGDLYVMSGPARWDWTHEIPDVNAKVADRYSFTFRSMPVLLDRCASPARSGHHRSMSPTRIGPLVEVIAATSPASTRSGSR